MEEILMTVNEKDWDLIKSGQKTMIVKKDNPKNIFYPFRVIVYISGNIGVVGKFDCDYIISTIRPGELAGECCMSEKEIYKYSAGRSVCGWHVKAGSVEEYEKTFPIEEATGIKKAPFSWRYLNRIESDG